MTRLLIALALIVNTGCAGIGFVVNPADGEYGVTLRAQDCINTSNVLGSLTESIPFLGPILVAQFGCQHRLLPKSETG